MKKLDPFRSSKKIWGNKVIKQSLLPVSFPQQEIRMQQFVLFETKRKFFWGGRIIHLSQIFSREYFLLLQLSNSLCSPSLSLNRGSLCPCPLLEFSSVTRTALLSMTLEFCTTTHSREAGWGHSCSLRQD